MSKSHEFGCQESELLVAFGMFAFGMFTWHMGSTGGALWLGPRSLGWNHGLIFTGRDTLERFDVSTWEKLPMVPSSQDHGAVGCLQLGDLQHRSISTRKRRQVRPLCSR